MKTRGAKIDVGTSRRIFSLQHFHRPTSSDIPDRTGKVNSFLFFHSFFLFFLFLQNKKFFFRLIENRSTARCILESPALFISRLVDAIEIFLSRPLCSRPLLIQDVHRQAATVSLKARIYHRVETWDDVTLMQLSFCLTSKFFVIFLFPSFSFFFPSFFPFSSE